MTLTLGQVIEAARNRNRAFDYKRITVPPIAAFLSDYQRELLGLAQERFPLLVTSQISVIFNAQPNTVLSQVGVGTPEGNGGLPAIQNPDGTLSQAVLPNGNTVEVAQTGPVLSQGTTLSATTNTLTPNQAIPSWTADQFDGSAYLVIIAGTGVGQIRLIQTNTTGQVTTTENWTTLPDTTSQWQIIQSSPAVTGQTSAVIALPSLATRTSYLTYIDSSGNVFLDLSNALTGTFDVGFPLPPYKGLLGGTVYFRPSGSPSGAAEQFTCELTLLDYTDRLQGRGRYAVYEMNGQLFPIGDFTWWQNVQSLDLRYVPIPGDVTLPTDRFILPDDARGVLVDKAAEFMGTHVEGEPDVAVNLEVLTARAGRSEELWLQQVASRKRAFTSRVKDVW